ncbi:MAG: MFS transporter [Rhizobiaceae bacterium]
MTALRPLLPLILAAAILLGGNGIQSMLVPMRAANEAFGPTMIGLLGTAYFGGFLIGCLTIQRMMRAVGHVRTFAALAAIGSASALTLVLWIDPLVWMVLRFITGLAFAGLFTIMEAWLNAGVGNEHRARLLAVYRVVDITVQSAAPYLIPVFGAASFTIFALSSMMITLSMVPVALGDRSNPEPPQDVRIDIARAWAISPVGVFGALAAGLANGAVRSMAPVYAGDIGLGETATVTFLSLGIVGGGIVQFPLGWLSDRWDRRGTILIVGGMAAAMALALGLVGVTGGLGVLFALNFLYGCAAMPIYPLSAAHANDRAGRHEFVLLSAVLMMFWAVGAVGGPLFAAAIMQGFGSESLYLYVASVHALFVVATAWRINARQPALEQGSFTPFAGNPPRGLPSAGSEPDPGS